MLNQNLSLSHRLQKLASFPTGISWNGFLLELKRLKMEKAPSEIIDILANSEEWKMTHFEARLLA